MSEQELIERATRAYLRYCRANGFILQRPCQVSSEVVDGVVILANGRGPLAKFVVTRGGRLRRAEPAQCGVE